MQFTIQGILAGYLGKDLAYKELYLVGGVEMDIEKSKSRKVTNNILTCSVLVAQFTEWSVLIPEVHGLNQDIEIFL